MYVCMYVCTVILQVYVQTKIQIHVHSQNSCPFMFVCFLTSVLTSQTCVVIHVNKYFIICANTLTFLQTKYSYLFM